ncbi:MAG: hemolysin family protein [Victivallaceae bacterium]
MNLTPSELTINLILLLLLVLLSAFFSGAETALFSLSRARLLSYRKDRSPTRQAIVKLLNSYHHTLIALNLGNMLVNIGISITDNNLINGFSGLNPILRTILSVVVSVILLLLLGEVTPKAIALIYAESLSDRIALPVLYFKKIMFPLIWLSNKFFAIAINLLGRKKNVPLTPDEYSTYLEMSTASGAFSREEHELLKAAFELRELEIREIMTGRVEIINLNKSTSPEEIVSIIRTERHEFYPVIDQDIDDAEFILSAKDFFLMSKTERPEWFSANKDKCLFNTVFIPINATLTLALAAMHEKQVQAALTVDEYGRIAGMITVKDIYSELTGDLEIIYDAPDYNVHKLPNNTWLIDGMMPLFMFEELTGVKIPEEFESNTLNGFFCEEFGGIPQPGDEITVNGMKLRAEKISHHRVLRILAEKLPEREAGEDCEL